jgi:hypothetical protein
MALDDSPIAFLRSPRRARDYQGLWNQSVTLGIVNWELGVSSLIRMRSDQAVCRGFPFWTGASRQNQSIAFAQSLSSYARDCGLFLLPINQSCSLLVRNAG